MELLPEEFPILCETCLGPNPYIRMTREKHGCGCKICERPFHVYRWKPGTTPGMKSRYKKTEICPTCAKLKNVCQTCLLDLQYGLPVEVRDKALELEGQTKADIKAISHANRNFVYDQIERQLADGTGSSHIPNYGPVRSRAAEILINRVQRKGPYYKRNEPHLCSFFVRGICNRGVSCPYLHPRKEDLPKKDDPLANQNIKDRFFGTNDPVAAKLMNRHELMKQKDNEISLRGPPTTPIDETIRTLFISGIDESVTEDNVREIFSPHGQIQSVHLINEKRIGFVTFTLRSEAQDAISKLFDCLFVKGKRLRLDWGKSRRQLTYPTVGASVSSSNEPNRIPGPPGMPVPSVTAPSSLPVFSQEDQAYLKSRGVLPPQMPGHLQRKQGQPVAPPPPGMTGVNLQYSAQSATYGAARFNSAAPQ